MKVKIGNEIHDASIEPIMLIFDDDSQRLATASDLSNMQEEKGIRKYLMYPKDLMTEDEAREFMVLVQ